MNRKMMMTTLCLSATLLMSAGTVNAETTDKDKTFPINVLTKEVFYDTATAELKGTNFQVKLVEPEEQVEAVAETVEEVKEVKEVSPYANLAMGIAKSYVNIRKEPSMEAEIVGKLYEGAVGTIVKEEGDWIYINSDQLKGYVSKEYVAIGAEAEKLFSKYATRVATVNTVTLKVREKASTDSRALTLIPEGATYQVVKENDEWIEIKLDDYNGYVSKEFVDLGYEFEYGISLEEEEQNNREEEEAQRREEQSSNSSSNNSSSSNSSSSNSSSSNKGSSTSNSSNNTSSSSVGSKIASYAQQFVGNPYVWGGTSLTKGADCSGFTQSVFKKFGYSIPRTSSQQAKAGTKVSVSNIKPGDLVFYAKGGRVNHVAIYIGNGKVVHASNPKSGIKISKYNYRSIYTVRRIAK